MFINLSDLEILEHAATPIGTIYLGRRRAIHKSQWIYQIFIDGDLLMSSADPVSEKQLSTSALALHQSDGPLQILIGGLGLGHTADAALTESRVSHVRVIEKMDFVIDWMNRGLLPLSKKLVNDKRLEINQGDVYQLLMAPPSHQYDLILVDVDHSPDNRLSEASKPFYSLQGQRQAACHLNPGGILAVWSAHDNDEFLRTMEEVYLRTYREHVTWEDTETPDERFHNVLFFGVQAPAKK